MPKFIIYREHNNFHGTLEQEEIEAKNLEEANKEAYYFGLEMVDCWAEPVEEGTEDD